MYVCIMCMYACMYVNFLVLFFGLGSISYGQNLLKRHKRDWIHCVVINECCNIGMKCYRKQWGISWYHIISDVIVEVSYKPITLQPGLTVYVLDHARLLITLHPPSPKLPRIIQRILYVCMCGCLYVCMCEHCKLLNNS
jgi:hypothetical protein